MLKIMIAAIALSVPAAMGCDKKGSTCSTVPVTNTSPDTKPAVKVLPRDAKDGAKSEVDYR